MLLADVFQAFTYAKDLTPKSLRWYTETLTPFFEWLPGKETDVLTPENVRAYIVHRRASGTLSTWTLHGYMRGIKSLLNFMVKEGWLDWQPSRLEMPKRAQLVKETFTDVELATLFSAAKDNARDTAMLWLLLDTGVRADELVGLERDRVHLYKDDAYLVVYGKGRKHREVGPLGKKSRAALHRWVMTQRESDVTWVFPSAKRGTRLTVQGLEKLLKRLREKAGLTCDVNPHKFRHTYAVKYMQQPGASIYKLSKLLGHASVTTTEEYLRSFNQRNARLGGTSIGDTLAV
jgi:integrase/recombinase XerD